MARDPTRPGAQDHAEARVVAAVEHTQDFKSDVAIPAGSLAPAVSAAVARLYAPLAGTGGAAVASLERDAASVADDLLHAFDLLGWAGTGVQATLELIRSTPCPRWHADKVALRVLVCYSGRGTQWVADADALHLTQWQAQLRALLGQTDQVRGGPGRGERGARLLRGARAGSARGVPAQGGRSPAPLPQPGSTVDVRRGATVHEAGVGDVLVLKGARWPGSGGRGAVHRSPPPEGGCECCEGTPRLLLKLDPLPPGDHGLESLVWR